MTAERTKKGTTDPRKYVVRGRIIHPDGSPVVGEPVQTHAKRLRCDDEPLGKPARTDEDGRYVIEYDPGKRRSVDLTCRCAAARRCS